MDQSLQSPDNDRELGVLDLLLVFVKYKKTIFFTPVLAALVAFIVVFVMPSKYTATLKVAPSKTAPFYTWMLQSDALAETVNKQLGLTEHYDVQGRQATYEAIRDHVSITNNVKDGYVDVAVTDKDPKFAARFANALGSGMVDKLLALRLTDSAQMMFNFEARRDVAQQSLDKVKTQLAAQEIKPIVDDIPPQDRYGINSMAGIQAEAALQDGITELSQSEIIRTQEQVASLQRMVMGGIHGKLGASNNGAWIAAIDLLQQEAYWTALKDRLDRRIALLKRIEREEIKLIDADVPDQRSSPRRGLVIAIAALAGLVVAILAAFSREIWWTVSHDSKQSGTLRRIAQAWRGKGERD